MTAGYQRSKQWFILLGETNHRRSGGQGVGLGWGLGVWVWGGGGRAGNHIGLAGTRLIPIQAFQMQAQILTIPPPSPQSRITLSENIQKFQ